MAALTLQQQFGTNAAISSGVLSITLADLAAVGLNNSSPSPADIAGALVLLWKTNQGASADQDPTIGVVVSDPFPAFATRGSSSQIQYQYPVSLYVPNTTSAIDPDNIV